MLARSHVKTTAAVGVVAVSVGLVPFTEPRVALIAGGLYLAGGLLPDFDQAGSTASTAWILGRPKLTFRSEWGKRSWRWTRKWWPGTPWVSWVVRQTSTLLYRASRGPAEADDATPHRKFTHTAVGCVALGGLVAWGVSQLPHWAAALLVALLVGIVGQAFGRWWKWAVAIPVGLVAYGEATLGVAWPVWWVAVALGCALHCAGDSCSKNGTPFRWPLAIDGKRWQPVHLFPESLRFVTGGWGERVTLGLVYAVTAGLVWPAIAPATIAVG